MTPEDVKKIADQARAMLRIIPDSKTADEWHLFVVTQAINKALEGQRGKHAVNIGARPETETIDRLFLELSQFTNAKTAKELQHEEERQKLNLRIDELESGRSPLLQLRDDLTAERDSLQQKLETSLADQRRELCKEGDALLDQLKTVRENASKEIASLQQKLADAELKAADRNEWQEVALKNQQKLENFHKLHAELRDTISDVENLTDAVEEVERVLSEDKEAENYVHVSKLEQAEKDKVELFDEAIRQKNRAIAASAKLQTAVEAFNKYSKHLTWCGLNHHTDACTCGYLKFQETLSTLSDEKNTEPKTT